MVVGEIEKNQRIIPQNALTKGKILTIDWIRWVEAAIFCAITVAIVIHTNFVTQIKVIIIIVLCLAEALFFLRGIKNRSVLQVILEMILSRHDRKHFRLGSVNDARKNNTNVQYNYFGGESAFDRLVNRIKYNFKAFDAKYGEEHSNIEH